MNQISPDSAPQLSTRLFTGRVGRLALKELRETLRDRRTLLTLILMPVLLYPLLSLGFQRFLLAKSSSDQVTWRLAVENPDDLPTIRFLLSVGHAALRSRDKSAPRPPGDSAPEADPRRPPIEYLVQPQLVEALQADQVDVGLRVLQHVRPQTPRARSLVEVELVTLEGDGPAATEFIQRRLQAAGEQLLLVRLQEQGVRQTQLPVQFRTTAVTVPGGGRGVSLTSLVPLVLVLMTITGAVYPAIDLTAGERERNTLELLVAAPIPRLGLLVAKYTAVVTVAFLTAALNMVSMIVTLQATGMGPLVWGQAGLSLGTAGLIFVLLGVFAAFFSAVLLCITSFARSFKEAQAYLVPFMVLSMSPGLVTLLPGVPLSGPVAVVPLLNVTLLARDLLAGVAQPAAALLVFGTTAVYAAAALGLASRIFGTDAVLYDARAGWSDLFSRPTSGQTAASPALALGCLAILFPATFLASGFASQQSHWSLEMRLVVNSVLAALLFALVPTAVAAWSRMAFRPAFALNPPPWLAVPGAMLLGVSLWPLVHELVVLTLQAGLVTLSPEQIARGQEIVARLDAVPFWLVLFSLAVVPAVSEEWLFRGFVLSALRSRFAPASAVIGSGLLFGLFHLVATDVLAIERLAPSATLGVILGWVCWKTGSLWPGILLHTLHNGVNLALARFRDELAEFPWFPDELLQESSLSTHLPASWLAVSTVGVLTGLTLVAFSGRTSPSTASEPSESNELPGPSGSPDGPPPSAGS